MELFPLHGNSMVSQFAYSWTRGWIIRKLQIDRYCQIAQVLYWPTNLTPCLLFHGNRKHTDKHSIIIIPETLDFYLQARSQGEIGGVTGTPQKPRIGFKEQRIICVTMVDFPQAHRPSVKAVHILQLVTACYVYFLSPASENIKL